jgi:hypothetical protein
MQIAISIQHVIFERLYSDGRTKASLVTWKHSRIARIHKSSGPVTVVHARGSELTTQAQPILLSVSWASHRAKGEPSLQYWNAADGQTLFSNSTSYGRMKPSI